MNYSNQRDAETVGNHSVGRRQVLLGLILAVLAMGYGTHVFMDRHKAEVGQKDDSDYAAFMAAVAKADTISDPMQRCLSFPDLPNSHWNADTTRAYCAFRNHKTIGLSEIDALLKQGNAAEVDRIFQGYLDAEHNDSSQPGLLEMAFFNAGFDDSSKDARRFADLWKQQSPKSAFAYAASGDQYSNAAADARGTDWGYKLTDQQMDGMQEQLALAVQDLDRAESLDPSLTATYGYMIDVGGMGGDDAYMYKAAAQGTKIDPSNFDIRSFMMNYAQPRWGSAFGGVDAQSKEDLKLATKNPLLRMVSQGPDIDAATCQCNGSQSEIDRLAMRAADKNVTVGTMIKLAAETQSSNRRFTVELYSEALRFAPTHKNLIRWCAEEMVSLGDKQGAIAAVDAIVRLYPDNVDVAAQAGLTYSEMGEVKKAEVILQSVLQRDPYNYEALGWLGDLYNHGAHQPQKAEALADILISKYPDKPFGYIVRSCNQMDHNLPGVYDTIHLFIDRFGDDPKWKSQTNEMRAYLVKHPEKVSA